MNVPDNYSQWEAHERRQTNKLAKFPTCDYCGKTLYERLFRIDGEVLCESCVNDTYGEEVIIDE